MSDSTPSRTFDGGDTTAVHTGPGLDGGTATTTHTRTINGGNA